MSFSQQEMERLGEALQADITNIQQREISIPEEEAEEMIPEPTSEEELESIMDLITEEEEAKEEVEEEVEPAVYTGPLTREGLAEIVRDLSENAPNPIRNVDYIPNGVTPQEFVDAWSVGNITTNATYSASARISTNSDNQTYVNSMTVTPTEDTPVKKRRRGTTKPKVEEDLSLPESKEELIARKIKRGMPLHLQRLARKEKKGDPYMMQITPDDMFIAVGRNNHYSILSTDADKSGILNNIYRNCSNDRNTGNAVNYFSDAVLYDKNMNPLSVDFDDCSNVKSRAMFNLINVSDLHISPQINDKLPSGKFIIVDKKRLLESGGKDFRIRYKYNITYSEILKIKKHIISKVQNTKIFIDNIKAVIGNVYDEENFEIVYSQDFNNDSYVNYFQIFVQYPNLVIKNSIELEHTIENLIVALYGKYYVQENKYVIGPSLYGKRTTFSPIDGYYGYSHSHLPGGNRAGWSNFCMGSNHFLSHLGVTTDDLELEAMMIAMYDHVAWESLEGGPYYKMESIGVNSGSSINVSNPEISITCYSAETAKDIINELNKHDTSILLDAFTLTLDEGKNVIYTIDKTKFFENFISLFDNKFVENINSKYGLSVYLYSAISHTFRRDNSDRVLYTGNWDEIVKTATIRIRSVRPVYMNGEYIRPKIIDTGAPTFIQRDVTCFHPDFMLLVAKYIQYLLLTELKNENV